MASNSRGVYLGDVTLDPLFAELDKRPHCGSFLPFIAHRLSGISEVLVPKGLMVPVNVMANIQKLYFDLAGDALSVALDGLLLNKKSCSDLSIN